MWHIWNNGHGRRWIPENRRRRFFAVGILKRSLIAWEGDGDRAVMFLANARWIIGPSNCASRDSFIPSDPSFCRSRKISVLQHCRDSLWNSFSECKVMWWLSCYRVSSCVFGVKTDACRICHTRGIYSCMVYQTCGRGSASSGRSCWRTGARSQGTRNEMASHLKDARCRNLNNSFLQYFFENKVSTTIYWELPNN